MNMMSVYSLWVTSLVLGLLESVLYAGARRPTAGTVFQIQGLVERTSTMRMKKHTSLLLQTI